VTSESGIHSSEAEGRAAFNWLRSFRSNWRKCPPHMIEANTLRVWRVVPECAKIAMEIDAV
jgi:hypothetical protein